MIPLNIAKKLKNLGLKGIVFTSEVNKSIETDVDRVDNWLELEQKIKQKSLDNEKKSTMSYDEK